jgi:hypothetical protein
MKVHLTRDSVAAGDDVESHDATMQIDAADALALIEKVLAANYLPKIAGGRATWVAVSHKPVAVCAQQWPAPRLVPWTPAACEELLHAKEGVRLHFSYLAQIDPEIVLDVLKRTALKADEDD